MQVRGGGCIRAAGQLATKRLLLVVAGVAGKSVPAALLMATFHARLRTLAANPMPLVELVSSVNRYTCAHGLRGLRFTTAFLSDLDTTTGKLLMEIRRLQAKTAPSLDSVAKLNNCPS